jgi:LmbE family N-acetylglucosaminyl deacetylase
MDTTPTILLSFAHPDDESFFTAGISCAYADRGVRVVLSCATRGEAGTAGDPPLATREELPALRERELREAAAVMGIARLEFLNYRDRELADARTEDIRAQLVRLIREHRPQIVITFDPDGGNRHPDHIAISRFTADAVTAAADPRWILDAGAAFQVRRMLWTCPVIAWETTKPERLATLPGVDFLIDVSEWRDRKASALRAHRSQRRGIDRLFFLRPDSEAVLSTEIFRQAWGEPLAVRPERDLFAGILDART